MKNKTNFVTCRLLLKEILPGKIIKRFLLIIIALIMIVGSSICQSTKKLKKTLKIGVIDSCVSENMLEKYNVTEINDILGRETKNDVTHGSMILSIILQNVSSCNIFYCSIFDENCIGDINNAAKAIDWCVENDVDIITMSFATLNDNELIKNSIQRALDNDIVVIASCINLSSETCYPAMYDGVISVSDGFNDNAMVILKGKKVKFEINGTDYLRREVSFLTAYVCGKITEKLSKGETMEEILNEKISGW